MPFESSKQRKFFGACLSAVKQGKKKLSSGRECPPKKVLTEFFKEERKKKNAS